jgi:hypothetical protein
VTIEDEVIERLKEIDRIGLKHGFKLNEQYVRGFLMGADKNNEIPPHHYDSLVERCLK